MLNNSSNYLPNSFVTTSSSEYFIFTMVGIRYLSKSEQSLFKNFTEILNILIIRFIH